MKEGLAVRNEALQVAKLRPVHGRMEDLGDDAVPEREPDLAGSRVRRPHSVLGTVRPPGWDPGMPKRAILIFDLRHFHLLVPSLLLARSVNESKEREL